MYFAPATPRSMACLWRIGKHLSLYSSTHAIPVLNILQKIVYLRNNHLYNPDFITRNKTNKARALHTPFH